MKKAPVGAFWLLVEVARMDSPPSVAHPCGARVARLSPDCVGLG